MGTDAYLEIVFPGMTDWEVRECHAEDGTLLGYKVVREQTAAMTLPGKEHHDQLTQVRADMDARAARLNQNAQPLQLPRVGERGGT